MEGSSSGVSGQDDVQKFDTFDNQEQGWKVELNNVNTDQNGWRVQPAQATDGQDTGVVDANGQLKPEVAKVLNNFIGTMMIEMVKKQSPAQKISMDDE